MVSLQVVGGGKMGQALIQGLIEAGWAPSEAMGIVEVSPQQREVLARRFPGVTVAERPEAGVDTLVAVKPHLVLDVCGGLERPGRVLSVAAGITLAAMEAALPDGTPVVRAMPNTPALVGAGAAGLAPGTSATEADLDWATGILGAVGRAVVVTEAQLDAVTGLSGSGPAYVFLLAEALIDAGVAVGLPRETASLLARQTIHGAGSMLVAGSMADSEGAEGPEPTPDPVALRAAVTTPAGTTAAGLGALEQHGFRAAVAAAVRAASDRSVELGRK